MEPLSVPPLQGKIPEGTWSTLCVWSTSSSEDLQLPAPFQKRLGHRDLLGPMVGVVLELRDSEG